MRVLMVANTLPPTDVSGVGEQVLQLAAGLRELGHEVEVLGRGPGQARGPKLLFPLAVVPPFLRRLRSLRPHVVQVHESDGALAALATATLAAALEPPPRLLALLQVSYREEIRAVRSLEYHGRTLGRPGTRERRFRWTKAPLQVVLGCLTAWLADRVLAPSERTGRELMRDYGIDDVRTLPNVTGGLAPSPAAGDPPRARPYLLFVGRLRIRKGVEVLLEALGALGPADRPQLLIAGDGEHRAALEATAERLGLGSAAVEFLGRCSAQRVRRLLGGAGALVVPSIYEGMPLVVLEAMEAGVPVIASAVSGIPEVVRDGETGWLVPPEDPPALAQALREALASPLEAGRRGAAGRLRLDDRYRPRHAAAAWEEVVGDDG